MADVVRQLNWPAAFGVAVAGASLVYSLLHLFRRWIAPPTRTTGEP